jgi:hypothetical protein
MYSLNQYLAYRSAAIANDTPYQKMYALRPTIFIAGHSAFFNYLEPENDGAAIYCIFKSLKENEILADYIKSLSISGNSPSNKDFDQFLTNAQLKDSYNTADEVFITGSHSYQLETIKNLEFSLCLRECDTFFEEFDAIPGLMDHSDDVPLIERYDFSDVKGLDLTGFVGRTDLEEHAQFFPNLTMLNVDDDSINCVESFGQVTTLRIVNAIVYHYMFSANKFKKIIFDGCTIGHNVRVEFDHLEEIFLLNTVIPLKYLPWEQIKTIKFGIYDYIDDYDEIIEYYEINIKRVAGY